MKNYLKKSKLVTVYFTKQNLKPQNQTLQAFVCEWGIMHGLHFTRFTKIRNIKSTFGNLRFPYMVTDLAILERK